LSVPLNEIVGVGSQPENIKQEDLSLSLEMLVKQGLVEPLVGEDGEFYFVLTREGKELEERKKKRDDKKGG